ncbi:hypothetical protein [Nocardioides sp. URHA0020]|uniref:hypothetical protein n=1 Tax=Nocardioides sp. URHA0020 TaxID=1380392 RepID=UPI00048B25CB|nr:hypothetical protein [Nocardioides sp. URHA0020]
MDETEEDRARALQTAQVILDGVTAADPGIGDAVINDAMQLAFGRLLEIGAIEITVEESDDEEAELEVDIAPLLSGITLVVGHLVDRLARLEGSSREDVIANARESLNG